MTTTPPPPPRRPHTPLSAIDPIGRAAVRAAGRVTDVPGRRTAALPRPWPHPVGGALLDRGLSGNPGSTSINRR